MINFNVPICIGDPFKYMRDAIDSQKICGDGKYTRLCSELLEDKIKAKKVFLTTSGTAALEMACLLLDLDVGDEVILPSFTFSSSATAIIMGRGTPVFVDINKDTMNIDEEVIIGAISERTKAIMVVHYAGVSCNMDRIMGIAREYNLLVIEDAAQGVGAKYKDQYLGTIGDIGCFSFHETKNYSMGEGGALVLKDDRFIDRAAILREKGTDRTKFISGIIDKYTWVDKGSSYLPSDLLAAYLYPQLLEFDHINNSRIDIFNLYYELLVGVKGIDLPMVCKDCSINGHLFYIKVKDLKQRSALLEFLKDNGIYGTFHYIPLHSCIAGVAYGKFIGEDIYTTKESERLIRLPLYYGLKNEEIIYICDKVKEFIKENNG